MNQNGLDLQVVPDAAALAMAAVERFIQCSKAAMADHGRFCVALPGGSTPRAMFQQLSKPIHRTRVDWNQVHIFWGDERCVPADDPASNYRMARGVLLDFVSIPLKNIHRIPGEVGAEAAAEAYEQVLQSTFGADHLPQFDLILLGLGEDGHTASLFPGSPALAETGRWCVGVEHSTPPPPLVPRVTLTLPVINAAVQVLFLVSGQGKAEILRRVLQPVRPGENALPAQRVQAENGQVTWLVDREAGGFLTK